MESATHSPNYEEFEQLQKEYKLLKNKHEECIRLFSEKEIFLKSNYERLQLAVEAANLAWWEMDIATGNIQFDPRKALLLGYTPEQFTHYSHFMKLVHPDDYEPVMQAMRDHFGGVNERYLCEYRIKTVTGDYKWFLDNGAVTKRDIEGKPEAIRGYILDISERKATENTLKNRDQLIEATTEMVQLLLEEPNCELSIKKILAKIGTITGQDRVYIFEAHQDSEDKTRVSQIFEWARTGVEPQIGNPGLQNFAFEEDLPRWYSVLSNNQILEVSLSNVPPDEEYVLTGQGIISVLIVPILVKNKFWGFVGFDNCHDFSQWHSHEEVLLTTLGSLMGMVIQRNRIREELQEAKELAKWNETNFKTIANQIPGIVFQFKIDVNGKYSMPYISLSAQKIFERPNSELQNSTKMFDDIHPNDLQAFITSIEDSRSLVSPWYQEFRILVHKKVKWIRGNSTPLLQTDGSIVWHGVMFDITEEKRLQEELFNTNKRYQDLFEANTDGIVIFRLNSNKEPVKIIDLNENAAKLIGFTKEEIFKLAPSDFLHEINSTQLYHLRLELKLKGVTNFETKLTHKQGNKIFVEVKINHIDYNNYPAMLVIVRDISNRKIAENKLKESETNFRNFFNTIDDFLFILDEQGCISHTNEKVNKKLGYLPNELLGQPVIYVHPESRRSEALQIVGEMLSGKADFCPVPLITKQGELIPVETRVSQGFWDNKPAIFGVSKDLSLLKQTEEKFTKAFYLNPFACSLSLFDSGIYTEVNDAFTTIFGFTKEETLGKTAMELGILPYELREWLKNQLDENGKCINVEMALTNKNKQKKFVLLSAEVLTMNNVKYCYTIANDITEIKLIEQQVAESQKRFNSFMHHTPVFAYIKDKDLNIVYKNKSSKSILGSHTEAKPNQGHWFSNELLTELARADQEILLGNSTSYETVFNAPVNGEDAWIHEIKFPLTMPDGTIGVGGIAMDVTVQRVATQTIIEAKEKAEASEYKVRSMFQNAITGFLYFTPEGKVLEANPAVLKILGSPSLEATLQINLLTFPPIVEVGFSDSIRKCIETKQLVIDQKVYTSKWGKTIFIKYFLVPLVIEGKVKGIWANLNDLTDLWETQQHLQLAKEQIEENEKKYRLIAENTSDGILVINSQYKVVYVSPSYQKLMGFDENEKLGITNKEIFEMIHSKDRQSTFDSIFDAIRNKKSNLIYTYRVLHKLGHYIWREDHAHFKYDDKGNFSEAYILCRDISFKKLAEEKLIESEKRLQKAQEIAHIGNWEYDITNKILWASDEALRIYGTDLSSNYVPLETIKKAQAPEYHQVIDESLRNIIFHNIPSDIEYPIYRLNDNELRYVHSKGERVTDVNGKPFKVIGVVQDITDRKLAEKEIKEINQRMNTLIEAIPDAIFFKDGQGRWLITNEPAKKLYKIHNYNWFNKTDEQMGNERAEFYEAHRMCMLGDEKAWNEGNLIIENEIMTDDSGNRQYFEVRKVPLFDEQNQRKALVVIGSDITRKHELELELQKFSNAIEQNVASVIITNSKGIIEYVNPGFYKITGYQPNEVLGKNPSMLKSGKMAHEFYSHLWETITKGQTWKGEFCNRKANGDLYWEFATISPIFDVNNEIIHFVAIKEDITEKKDTEKRILKATIQGEERERNRFSKELHDGLGPILSTIKLFFQWMAQTDDENKKQLLIKKGNENIEEAINSLREISNNLSPRDLNTFGLASALKAFIENYQDLKLFSIQFHSNIDYRLTAEIEITLYRIVIELLNNSVKHSKANKIEIGLTHIEQQNLVEINFTDNGVGMDYENNLKNVSGNGLININNRVLSHNGTIHIQTAPNKGFAIQITLPV